MKSYERQPNKTQWLFEQQYLFFWFNIIENIWNNVCIQCNKIYIRDLVIFRHFIPLK